MFNSESALVQSWKRLIEAGLYALEDVPALSNLPEAVAAVLEA